MFSTQRDGSDIKAASGGTSITVRRSRGGWEKQTVLAHGGGGGRGSPDESSSPKLINPGRLVPTGGVQKGTRSRGEEEDGCQIVDTRRGKMVPMGSGWRRRRTGVLVSRPNTQASERRHTSTYSSPETSRIQNSGPQQQKTESWCDGEEEEEGQGHPPGEQAKAA